MRWRAHRRMPRGSWRRARRSAGGLNGGSAACAVGQMCGSQRRFRWKTSRETPPRRRVVAAEGASAPRHFHTGERVALPLAWSWTFETKNSDGSGRRLRLSSEHTGFKFEQSVKQASVAESFPPLPTVAPTRVPTVHSLLPGPLGLTHLPAAPILWHARGLGG